MHKNVKKPFVKLIVNHAIKDMERSSVKTNRKYKRHLTKRLSPFVKKILPQYKSPNIETSNFYVPAGSAIILQPDSNYNTLFKYNGENVFYNHMFEPYIYLTKLHYIK